MNLLLTDEQTIDDLGIFDRRSANGIYDLYNQTHTRGGENMLKELFLNPLSDREEINRRSSIIEHFAALAMDFPFGSSLFDMAEKYMLHTDITSKSASQHNMPGEKEIQNGVTAVIELIQGIKIFIGKKEILSIDAYRKEREVMHFLVEDVVFQPVLKENLKSKPSYTAIAAYDVLFRVQEQQKIKRLLGHIYSLDVYMSVATLAVKRGFVFPRVMEDRAYGLQLEGVYHPELKKPVANDVMMSPDKNVIFLTGANMAGKSTFLRSVSTAVYIAHIGFPVAARSMAFSVFDGMFTTINLPDNLGIGASHFYNEVLRVKKVAAELYQGKSLFVVFDELFRGTNVKDAYDGTVAVTAAFASKKNSLFIISSHIVEASDELKKKPSVCFYYLPTHMNGHVPQYTYHLEQGITDDRHGMIIINNEGVVDILKKGRKKKVRD